MKQKRRHGHGRRLLEIGKDILIVFLVLVNVTLAIMCLPTKTLTQTKWLASALRPFAGLFGLNEAELTYTAPATGSAFIGAAQPVAVTLSTEAGRQSAQYDFAALDTLYGQYGGLLAQALESAETPQACAESAFYAALRKPGTAFCFPGQISPAVLGAWLNVRAPEGADAQWYVLALDGETVQLYLLGDGCYRAQTALSAETLAAELSAAVPDGSFFAFESDDAPYSALDPLSLISASSAAVCTGLGTNPCDARFISALATQIGINPYGDARFVGNDGTTSFTETGLRLRVSAQGRIELQILQPDGRFQSASAGALDRIEAARSLLSRLTGDSYGEARVYLQSYRADGQSAVCTFGYYLSGIDIARAARSSSASTARRSRTPPSCTAATRPRQRPQRSCPPRRQPPACRRAARSAFCTPKAPAVNSPPVGRRSKLDMYLPTMHWRGSA